MIVLTTDEMTSYNAETRSCKDEKERKSSSETFGHLSEVDVLDCDYSHKSCSMGTTPLDGDIGGDHPINNNLGSDVAECNLESNVSQIEEKKRDKKKKRPQTEQNGQIDCLGVCTAVKLGENVLISNNQNDSLSPNTSLVEDHDNKIDADPVSVEKGDVKIYQIKGKSRPNRRKRWNSFDSEENAESNVGDRQTSTNSNEVSSFELSENEIGRVQPGEYVTSVKVVENVLTEKTSSNPSNGDLTCAGGKEITEKEKDVDLDPPLKEGNLPQVSLSSLQGLHFRGANKKLLILDVNGLLADIVPYCYDEYKADIVISRKSVILSFPVFKRPFCDNFMQFCFEKFNVGVWSSRTKKNVDMVIDFLMGDSRRKLLFSWHQSHCTDTGFTTVENSNKPLLLKELKKLWDKLEPDLPWNKGEYNESNTLLLDDSPYKALRNPAHTAVFPLSYRYKNSGDTSLGFHLKGHHVGGRLPEHI
ncbi:uncharacterized protein LOC110617475 isoform X3 [Manihot esculenta]|uniref:uncharacterized protein LOC110617475 isoform X3 n=1 Tax=Manihot esculenta TaxID=3983 RepID=UPI000B5D7750|nr:uncharacterized protein LOC110617475 isoform X3 [Manihot esculenta]